ncbi:MAG: tetratricopeptide repeat protein [Verrucomicrobiota bacterium]|jgi:tetratricopeptide (TPR) repeat protein
MRRTQFDENHGKTMTPNKSAQQFAEQGLKLWRDGQHSQALNCYNQAIVLAPEDAIFLVNRANLQMELGNLEEAMQDFERAQKVHPQLPDYMFSGLNLWKSMTPKARQAWIEKRRNSK